MSRIPTRRSLALPAAVFGWVLGVLARKGLIDGKTPGVDTRTLEANAALRSIVRRDPGESSESFLKELARQSGTQEPTRADIAKLDKKCPKKVSNKDWVSPHDPDAEIMQMTSAGTHLAHEVEHAVHTSDGRAVLAVTLHGGARGDTKSLPDTPAAAQAYLEEPADDWDAGEQMHTDAGRCRTRSRGGQGLSR